MNNIYRFIVYIIFTFIAFNVTAQTETLEGIINEYTTVTQVDQCDGVIQVTNASNFNIGDKVLIIQMQGAKMNETNTAVFGILDDPDDIQSAGLYEKNEIIGISGTTITLQFALLNDYDITASVQLVSVPVYENARVNGIVRAKAWDGETGGIIALEVTNQLTVNGTIDASGMGFRGGQANNVQSDSCASVGFLGPITSFHSELNNWRAAQKGEGIAAYIEGKEAGRGPQINGGGGANTHQSGGGGGAHHTLGGNGGDLESLGACKGVFPGGGGFNLIDVSERIFMGGGGGGGHGFANGTNGGNGGGIIMITANNLGGNGEITAAGIDAIDAIQEGAGGGGAGGSILLELANTLGNDDLGLDVHGGNGGDTDSAGDPRCFGPGGGGSGGRIYTTLGTNLRATRGGGEVGRVLNSSSACTGTSNSATIGGPGVVKIFRGLRQSNIALGEAPTIATCGETTGSSVQFFVGDIGVDYYEYYTVINDGLASEIDTTTANLLEVDGLNSTDIVSLIIQGVGGQCRTAADTIMCTPDDCSGIFLEATTNIQSVYCLDTFPRPLIAEPEGGVFVGPGINAEGTFTPTVAGLGEHELFYQYTDENGCVRLDMYLTEVIDTPEPPEIICSNANEGVVEFTWTHPDAELFRVISTVNGALFTLPSIVSEQSFIQEDLSEGDLVEIRVVALNSECGDSEEAVALCVAQSCTTSEVSIAPPSANSLCNEDASIQLSASPSGGIFLGEGVDSTGLFDPANVVVPADNSSILSPIVYSFIDVEGCPPSLDTIEIEVLARPAPPIIECGNSTISSVEFIITQPLVEEFIVMYSINNAPIVSESFNGSIFTINNLNPDDIVDISVEAIGTNRCGNSELADAQCVANPCPIIETRITALDETTYCVGDEPVQLTAIPIGGVFRGTGVNNIGLFTPSDADLGTNVLIYSFSNEEGCSYGDTLIIEVDAPLEMPIVNCTSTSNTATFVWSATGANTYEYTISLNDEPPSTAQTTTETSLTIPSLNSGDVIEFSVRSIGGGLCGDSAFATAFCQTTLCANAPPSILNLDDVYCASDAEVALQATPAGGQFFLNNTTPINEFRPSELGTGFYVVTYSVMDALGCEQTQSLSVEVIDVPAMPVLSCGTSTADAVTFTFDNPNNDFFFYTIAVNGETVLIDTTDLDIVSFGGLDMQDIVEIAIAPLAIFECSNVERTTLICNPIGCAESDALINIEPFYCFDTTSVQIFAEPSGGIFNGNGITQDGVFTPSDVVEGPTTLTYRFLDAEGCEQIDTFMTEVIALPTAPILDCSDLTASSASFVWSHPDPDVRFQYAISINGGDFSATVVTTETSFTQTNLTPGTIVIIRLSTLSDVACGISEAVSFTCTTQDCPPVEAPSLGCGISTPSSVEFTWTHPEEDMQFEYSISVNGGLFSQPTLTTERSIVQTELSENAEVFIRLAALGTPGCPNSEIVEVSCIASACPSLTITIDEIEPVCLGLDEDLIDLVANFPDIIEVADFNWSGPGVINSVFDPTAPNLSEGIIEIRYELMGTDGCTYEARTEIELLNCGDASLAGNVQTEEGRGVNAVMLDLIGEIPQSTQTDFDGNYNFNGVESSPDYRMQLSRSDFVLNGVTVFDLVLIQKHILGTAPITSPYKLIAADVNDSGSVTAFDLVGIQQVLLNIEPSFPAGVTWKFIPADYVFPDPSNPWSAPIPDASEPFEVTGMTQRNYIAIKLGDLNGTAFTD